MLLAESATFALFGNLSKEVVVIYNEYRPHYSCGYLTPEQMHRQSERKIKTYKNTTHNGARSIVCN